MKKWKLKNGTVVRYETEFGHSYYIDDEYVVGMTTMLEMGTPHPQGLLQYFKRTDQHTQEEILLDAQERGTNVHQAIEQLLMGEEVYPSDLKREDEKKAVAAFIDFFLTVQPEDVVSEHVVAYIKDDVRFAGTLDFIGTINGKRVLIDFKTSKIPSLKNALQVRGYQEAVEQSTGEKIDACYTLHLGTAHKGTRSKEDDNGLPTTGRMWNLVESVVGFDDVLLAYRMMLLANGGNYPTPPTVMSYPEVWQLTQSEVKEEVNELRQHEQRRTVSV